MRIFGLFAGLIFAANAAAQDFATTFVVNGLTDGDDVITAIKLDLGIGKRYGRANGVLEFAGGAVPVTGTCDLTNALGVLCSLTVGAASLTLVMNPNTFQGTAHLLDANGILEDTGTIQLISAD